MVSDAVVIETPYRPEDCRQGAGTPKESLIRVKKVVSGENPLSLSDPYNPASGVCCPCARAVMC